MAPSRRPPPRRPPREPTPPSRCPRRLSLSQPKRPCLPQTKLHLLRPRPHPHPRAPRCHNSPTRLRRAFRKTSRRARRRVPTPWARWPATPRLGHRRPINTGVRRQTRTRRFGRPLRPLRPVDTVTTACAMDSSPAEQHWSCWPPASVSATPHGTTARKSPRRRLPTTTSSLRVATAQIPSGSCPGTRTTPAAGTPDRPRRARPARVTSTPLPTKSTRAWSTSTRRSATNRSRRRAPASW